MTVNPNIPIPLHGDDDRSFQITNPPKLEKKDLKFSTRCEEAKTEMATTALVIQKLLQEPVLFLKPTSSYLDNGGTIEIPHPLESLHHEVEHAVVIDQKIEEKEKKKKEKRGKWSKWRKVGEEKKQ
ncbi:Probable acylpyruvase FAHD1, mitochondrial [Linum perenne]